MLKEGMNLDEHELAISNKLNEVRAEHAAFVDKYNAMALPTLEALGRELCTNQWLCAVIQRVVKKSAIGFTGGVWVTPGSFKNNQVRNLEYNDLVAAVPYLRRLGYTVVLFSDEDYSHPFKVGFRNQTGSNLAPSREDVLEHICYGGVFSIRMHGTSPKQIRRRGLLKCVPRLLGWLRQARIVLADPRREATAAALAAERLTLFDSGSVERERVASVQIAKKRKLIDALHADEDDVAKGARWANIQEHGMKKRFCFTGASSATPMRIEAVVDNHFIFQRCVMHSTNYQHEVVTIHRDAFDVAPWPKQGLHADILEEFFDNRFRDDACDENEDEDEDDPNDEA